MTVRSAAAIDLPRVVDVHLASFEGFFLSSLGPRFLRLLYHKMMEPGTGYVLVGEVEGEIKGFVGGVLQQRGFYSRLIRESKWAFAAAAFTAVLRRPWIVPRLARALRRPAEVAESAADACLMSIGVDPEAKGRGIGRRLLEAFCDELRKAGCHAVCLTTDKRGNERTIQFYERSGFLRVREFTSPEGREMLEYCRVLD